MQQTTPTPTRILRKPTVIERVALSGTTLWRLERAGKFPKHIQLGANSIGWRESDIEAWIAERAAEAGPVSRAVLEKIPDATRAGGPC